MQKLSFEQCEESYEIRHLYFYRSKLTPKLWLSYNYNPNKTILNYLVIGLHILPRNFFIKSLLTFLVFLKSFLYNGYKIFYVTSPHLKLNVNLLNYSNFGPTIFKNNFFFFFLNLSEYLMKNTKPNLFIF